MTVRKIVEQWLKENNYDGLYHEHAVCFCKLSDLMPCDRRYVSECNARHEVSCINKCKHKLGWLFQHKKPEDNNG